MKSMLKASLLVLGVAVGLAGVPAARAQSALGGPDAAWYAGGAVGQSSNALCKQPFGVGVCDDSDTAYRIFAGYQVNRYLALEFGYHQLGDTTLSSAGLTQTVESKAFDLVAVGNLPVAQRFGVYGKLGLYRASLDFSSNLPGVANQSFDNTGLTYGVGVQYDVTPRLGLRAEWQQFANMGGGIFISNSNIDLTSIGAIWRFK